MKERLQWEVAMDGEKFVHRLVGSKQRPDLNWRPSSLTYPPTTLIGDQNSQQPQQLDQVEIERLIEQRVVEAVGQATKQVFTREEACDFLRIGKVTLWSLTKRGLLRPNRATGKPLYLREDLDRFMRDNRSLLAER